MWRTTIVTGFWPWPTFLHPARARDDAPRLAITPFAGDTFPAMRGGRRFITGLIGRIIRGCLLTAVAASPRVFADIRVDPRLPPDAAALVDGQTIPKHLVEVFLKNDREALGLTPQTDEGRTHLASLPAAILDELVDRALIAQEARRRGIEPTAAQLDADEKRLITFCGNDARYDLYTAQNGFNRQEYRENVLRPTAAGQAMITALTRDLALTDEEVTAYYDAHLADADFQLPERVTGEHILIAARRGVIASQLEQTQGLGADTPAMDEAIAKQIVALRQTAETLRQQAVAPGADFAALAKARSDDPGTRDAGGSLGTFAHGVHPAALDDAFFALKPGEVGPVVQTDFGFHVIRISDRSPAGQRTLMEATPEIRHRLLREKSARRLREWLAESRAKAKIVVRDLHDLPPPP